MLVILTQNWSILTKFAKKNPAKSAVFYWLFLGEVFPKNFPWNRPIFLRICPENPSKFDFFPLKSREIGRFFCEFWLSFLPRNRPIFERILSFFPWKSREIGRFFRKFAPENPTKFCVFFHEISEALSKRVKTAVLLQRPVASALRCLAFTIGQLQNPIFFIKFSLRHPGSQKVSSTVQVYLPTFSEI